MESYTAKNDRMISKNEFLQRGIINASRQQVFKCLAMRFTTQKKDFIGPKI